MAPRGTLPAKRMRIAAVALGLILGLAGLLASAKWLALAAIEDYQAKISPFKGYRCAYATLHGGTTCSAYGKRVIRDQGLWKGSELLRKRFRECQEAARILRDRQYRNTARSPSPDRRLELQIRSGTFLSPRPEQPAVEAAPARKKVAA